MRRQIFVTLLESVVLLDVMEVVSSDHYSSLHLHALDNPRQNPTSNTHITSEWTLLINICAFYSLQSTIRYFWPKNMTNHSLVKANLLQRLVQTLPTLQFPYLSWSLESQPDIPHKPPYLLLTPTKNRLLVLKNGPLFLIRLLCLWESGKTGKLP